MVHPLQNQLRHLNTASLGSFGERLFCQVTRQKGISLIAQHRQEVDFEADGQAVDVKTTIKHIGVLAGAVRTYGGKRVSGVSYALVEFFADGARISIEGSAIGFLTWPDLDHFYQEWQQRYRLGLLPLRDRQTRKLHIGPIKRDIIEFFRGHGVATRMIYRTCQTAFGPESPHNLKPRKALANRITVYVDFKGQTIALDNVHHVYAFPDTEADTLPMRETAALHHPKVDLNRMPSRFVFSNIDDLKTNFRRIFQNHCSQGGATACGTKSIRP